MKQTETADIQEKETYWRPLLRQPDGAVEGVAGLQDGRLRGVETLPFLCGGDDTLHVLLHAGHRATLYSSTAGGGACGPGAALPSVKMHHMVTDQDSCCTLCGLTSPQSSGCIPRQWVVEVVWHDLLVAVTKRWKQRH